MSDLKRRLNKLEGMANGKSGGIVVFSVRYCHEDEDFDRQHGAFIARGGHPGSLFIAVTDYAEGSDGK